MAGLKNYSVIVGAKRTPVLRARNKWHNVSAIDLGAAVIKDLLKGKGPEPDQVIMGTFANPRDGVNPAKDACTKAGFEHLSALTINKVCSSGLMAPILGDALVKSGAANCVIAGGMENLLVLSDDEMRSILTDPYTDEITWHAGEWCAKTYKISRQAQDNWAVESYKRVREAYRRLEFVDEIVPFREQMLDEEPFWKMDEEAIRSARPFKGCETVTPANSSKNAGGAAAVMITNKEICKKYGLRPLSYIVSHASAALRGERKEFTIAPPFAIRSAVEKAGLILNAIDILFINTAFGSVTLHASCELGVPLEKINPNGDAVSIGHPIGATGAKLIVEAVRALINLNKRYAVVCTCNAPGEAVAMVIKNAQKG